MSLKPQPLNANLFYGKVIATYPEARVIDVKWPNLDVIKRSVVVVQGSENYSFPKVDEVGLVIGNDVERYYYLGKIEFAYNRRLAGEDKDPATGKKWPLSLIDAGEVYLLNILTGVGLRFSNSGDFSLKNRRDGLKYILEKAGNPLRWLTLAAKAVTLSSKTTELNVGAVIRSVPVLGNAIIKGVVDKTKAAQEFLVKVTQIVGVAQVDKARLHLGDILVEPVASAMGAIPKLHTEIASLGGVPAPLRANLAVCNEALAGVEIASVKMDQTGNLSINATAVGGTGSVFIHGDTQVVMGGPLTAKVDINALNILLGSLTTTQVDINALNALLSGSLIAQVNAPLVFLGCASPDVSQPMVKGSNLAILLAAFLGACATSPTPIANPADLLTWGNKVQASAIALLPDLTSLLSTKVFGA